ncbi:hypothetical protein MMB17_21035 [Methylobacterium organophilum]|uniref:hypothetical protein n=1 Tax=Methylobacterium organophilum TaxID=410 RepID=UPI001F12DACC|nr:hypothetical protein [Methylobacterium organophilum]UMY17102.1 hypothetical protein MMB17_21035 [Methylobacterium organophilum]
MSVIGFNIKKGELWYCILAGTRGAPVYVGHDRHRFDAAQPRTELANYFKQTFAEVIDRAPGSRLAYRLSLEAKKADQVAYLTFPFGILNLVAHERGLHIREYVTQSFTAKALGVKDDKFAACDALISGRPGKWDKDAKLAALSAWVSLDE